MAKPRIGLVLGGGGARGAFTVGVINHLHVEHGLRDVPLISGTSTGALIGTLVCQRRFSQLEKIYTTVQTSQIVNPHAGLLAAVLGMEAALFASVVFGGDAVFSAAALADLIDKNVDFARVKARAADSHLIYNAVDLVRGDLRTFNNRDHTEAELSKALLASASEPVFMDPVVITEGNRKAQLVDGGIRELIPLGAAFRSGVDVDALIVISTRPLDAEPAKKPFEGLLSILGRTMDLLLVETGTNDVKLAQTTTALLRLAENALNSGVPESDLWDGIDGDLRKELKGKRSIPVVVVAPEAPLGVESLNFEPGAMRRMMNTGVERAAEILDPILEDWPPKIAPIA